EAVEQAALGEAAQQVADRQAAAALALGHVADRRVAPVQGLGLRRRGERRRRQTECRHGDRRLDYSFHDLPSWLFERSLVYARELLIVYLRMPWLTRYGHRSKRAVRGYDTAAILSPPGTRGEPLKARVTRALRVSYRARKSLRRERQLGK